MGVGNAGRGENGKYGIRVPNFNLNKPVDELACAAAKRQST